MTALRKFFDICFISAVSVFFAFQQHLGYGEIVGRRELDVAALAIDILYWVADVLGEHIVVGRAEALFLCYICRGAV